MDSDDQPSLHLSLDNLSVPEPRAGTPYPDAEDQHARDILEDNGVPLSTDGLMAALDSDIDVLEAAAARVAGTQGERALIPRLHELAFGQGDTGRAAAAYALAQLGEDDGLTALHDCLSLSVEANMAPMQAAGSLARLGDPCGIPALERALRSSNELIRMVACKQLYFVTALDGRRLDDGQRVDAYALWDRALADHDPDVVWQAQAQLRELDTSEARDRVRKAE